MANVKVPPFTEAPSTVVGATLTSVFPFDFPFWESADILVYIDDELVAAADYTVEGFAIQDEEAVEGGYGSGEVTLDTAVNNCTVTIDRMVVGDRETQFSRSVPLGMPALNGDLNRLTARQQDIARRQAAMRTELDDFAGDVTATASNAASASASAGTATTQAGIATTKAGEAAADAVDTAADRVQTGLDAVATAADAVATAADRVQTGLDRVATGDDATATAADAVATAADRAATADKVALTDLEASTGAALVGSINDGTGAVAQTLQAWTRGRPVSVKDFGAVGDDATDDTAALAAAHLASLNVFYPAGTYRTTAQIALRSNQRVEITPNAIVKQVTANEVVFDGNGVSDVLITGGGTVQAVGSLSATTNGAGVRFRGSSGSKNRVVGITVTNHRGFGVLLNDQTYCEVSGCLFLNSPVVNSDSSDATAGDIGLIGATSHCVVSGNRCLSGNGIGVCVQTITAGDSASYNAITGNVIANCKVYGILLYRTNLADYVLSNAVTGNNIKNTTGSIFAIATSSYTFGSAIYVQGAEDSAVSGNAINGTHTYARTFAEALSPAAIGTANTSRVLIANNVITEASRHGIEVADANGQGSATGAAIVIGNTLTTVGGIGIYLKQKGRVYVVNNTMDTVTEQGIYAVNTVTKRPNVVISGNLLKNLTTTGITVGYVKESSIDNNTVYSSTNYPVYVNNADDFAVSNNTVIATSVNAGIEIDTACTRFSYTGNRVVGTTVTAGHGMDSRPDVSTGNTASGCTNVWTGNYSTGAAAAPTSGTWVVGDIVYVLAPAAGGYVGYVCTTAGTPGTWKGYGNIAA